MEAHCCICKCFFFCCHGDRKASMTESHSTASLGSFYMRSSCESLSHPWLMLSSLSSLAPAAPPFSLQCSRCWEAIPHQQWETDFLSALFHICLCVCWTQNYCCKTMTTQIKLLSNSSLIWHRLCSKKKKKLKSVKLRTGFHFSVQFLTDSLHCSRSVYHFCLCCNTGSSSVFTIICQWITQESWWENSDIVRRMAQREHIWWGSK